MPTIAACAQCGNAIHVPGAAPMSGPAPGRHGAPQGRYPAPGYYAPPQKSSNTAAIVVIVAIIGFFVIAVGAGVREALSEENAWDIPEPPPTPPSVSMPERYVPPPVEWETSSCPEGQYAVLMPGEAEDKTGNVRLDEGRLVSHNRTCDERIGHFEVNYHDYPVHDSADDATVLARQVDVLVKYLGCQPDLDRPLTLKAPDDQEFSGCELSFQMLEERVRRYRIYLVKNRMYLVWVEYTKARYADDAMKFLTSFRLIGNIPKEGWPSSYLPAEPKPDKGTAVPTKKADRGTAVPEKK